MLLPYSMEMVVAAATAAVAVDAEAARARDARHTHCWFSFTESTTRPLVRSQRLPAVSIPVDNETTSGLPSQNCLYKYFLYGRGGLIFGRIWNNTGTSMLEVKHTFKFTANVYISTLKIHTLMSDKKALREGSSSAHGGDLS